MAVLLVILLFCVLALALTGALDPGMGFLIGLASLAGLVMMIRQDRLQNRQLSSRRQALQARWALRVRHLGGLPLPVDTAGSLFFLGDRFVLETEPDLWTFNLADLRKILLISSDQILKVSDQQLCAWLLAGSSRTLAALREKIRHHDRAIRRSGLLLIVFQSEPEHASLLILSAGSRPQRIAGLLQEKELSGIVSIRLLGQRFNMI